MLVANAPSTRNVMFPLCLLAALVAVLIAAVPPVAAAGDDGSSLAAEVTGNATARGNPYVPVYHPELTILPARGEITVDAELDDPGWVGAAVADNFAEHNPGDQTRPGVDTEVLVTYDQDNLYLAWICYDDPAEVRASFCERDNIFRDDYVILALDMFGEKALAYEIAANPYGLQGDLLFSIGNGEDTSYDMIFESAGRITEYGYLVEMAIPFAEMRFPQVEEQVWHVDFWRNRPRESRYQYSWAAYDRNESCWPCQWGTVRGARGIEGGSGLELLPSVVFHQSGSRSEDGAWENRPIQWSPLADDRNVDLGLGISYDISSEFTAEATINPDFSQVESDAAQIDVNSAFALFYPERRPFFQEGSDLFSTYFNAVYTRSVNDPIAAAKMTGRKGKTSVAYLSARDDHSVIILPFAEGSAFVLNGKSTSNILRARHEIGDQTYLGVVATDRRFDGGGAGSVTGLDGKLRLSQNDAVEWQFLATRTAEVDNPGLTPDWDGTETFAGGDHTRILDGEDFWGHGLYASYERFTRNFWLDVDYWQKSPTFRADSGFEPANDTRQPSFNSGYHFRFEDEGSLLERISPSVDGGMKWDFDGTRKDEWVNAHLEWRLRKAQTAFHARYMASNELYHGIPFDGIWVAHICGNSTPGTWLQYGGNFNYGHRIARFQEVMGKETSWGIWFDLKPFDRFYWGASLASIRSDDVETGIRLFSDYIARNEFRYQASRELSVRLIIQYRNGARLWEADPLVTYRLNPLSTFFVGSTRDYMDLNAEEHGVDGWRLTHRQYFVKMQYLFRT
ncbi:carbohydrate binding family 9 domain-containing protein [bacterium]|nr:carbohydrate binding family 9 domain-containing protein [bacterium]